MTFDEKNIFLSGCDMLFFSVASFYFFWLHCMPFQPETKILYVFMEHNGNLSSWGACCSAETKILSFRVRKDDEWRKPFWGILKPNVSSTEDPESCTKYAVLIGNALYLWIDALDFLPSIVDCRISNAVVITPCRICLCFLSVFVETNYFIRLKLTILGPLHSPSSPLRGTESIMWWSTE